MWPMWLTGQTGISAGSGPWRLKAGPSTPHTASAPPTAALPQFSPPTVRPQRAEALPLLGLAGETAVRSMAAATPWSRPLPSASHAAKTPSRSLLRISELCRSCEPIGPWHSLSKKGRLWGLPVRGDRRRGNTRWGNAKWGWLSPTTRLAGLASLGRTPTQAAGRGRANSCRSLRFPFTQQT